jgi:hypothetical protein
MKKNIQLLLLCAALFLTNGFGAKAQKLPNTQQAGLWAPDSIKIDGKPAEWGDKFQAYNKSTDIFYSIANDDKRLYLVVQTPDPGLINKILGGGIAFAINKAGKKDFQEAAIVTYPILRRENKIFINFSADSKIVEGVTTPFMRTDSFVIVNNSRLLKRSKFIMVAGIKNFDELISIYNQNGIKAISLFNNKMVYTYELAIDLELLGLNNSQSEKFTYNIKLPGISLFIDQSGAPNSGNVKVISSFFIPPDHPVSVPGNPHGYIITDPTDFWGEYTLAKKP